MSQQLTSKISHEVRLTTSQLTTQQSTRLLKRNEFVYLIQTGFKNEIENHAYKIGRTNSISTRMNSKEYKYKNIHLILSTYDSKQTESMLIKRFNENFKLFSPNERETFVIDDDDFDFSRMMFIETVNESDQLTLTQIEQSTSGESIQQSTQNQIEKSIINLKSIPPYITKTELSKHRFTNGFEINNVFRIDNRLYITRSKKPNVFYKVEPVINSILFKQLESDYPSKNRIRYLNQCNHNSIYELTLSQSKEDQLSNQNDFN